MNLILVSLGAIFRIIFLILFKLYGWVAVVGILAYLTWQNRRREQWVNESETTLLLIEVPRDNEKKELSAEQMFASLHGILRPKAELLKEGSLQEHISFEIAAVGNQIQFYVWTPRHLKDFVEGQIYAQYPSVHIKEGPVDYSRKEVGERVVYGTELSLTKSSMLPIKTFTSFEVDPLAGITAVLAKLDQSGEEMWIQILARPIDDTWVDKGHKQIDEIKNGRKKPFGKLVLSSLIELPIHILMNFLTAIFESPEAKKDDKKKEDKKDLPTGQQVVVKAIEEKIAKLGYEVKIRIAYLGEDKVLAKQRIQAIVGGFKQFNTTNLNGFAAVKYYDSPDYLNEYRARLFMDSGQIMNIEELASLYHLPHKSVETPNMVWTGGKTGEPPANLPSEAVSENADISLFGLTNYRGHNVKFGIKRSDRGRHLYIVGQTGTGKSFLLKLLALSDLYHNEGIAIIDPHGDFATDMLQYIPPHRLNDVIYFNPADTDFPIAFNPLEVINEGSKHFISTELVSVLRRMFESWGPRLEHILRMTILALLDYPDSTMLGITRVLTDKEFRKKVVKAVDDPVVKAFWVNEFASWNDKFASEAVAPVLNKVGAFTANPLVRNIIGQPKSAVDLRKIMDEGKILIVNLSRGLMGEDNAAILGALMVTKIQLAAMSRADMPIEQRRPFYLYVDEFQNFATDSFAVILSEARKYGLNLTVANQYISQMPDTVKDAVFGNVGSMVSFRVSATDSTYLGKYFEPVFEAGDLVRLNNQNVLISMSIDGEKATPFSARTLSMPDAENDPTAEIISMSRQRYASTRAEIEAAIKHWSFNNDDAPTPDAPSTTTAPSEPREQNPNNFLSGLKNPGGSQRHEQSRGSQHGSQRQSERRPDRPQPERQPRVEPGREDLQPNEVIELHK